jgi:AmmeMemoRadiSam system protein A
MTPLGEVRVNRTLARELANAHETIRFLPAAHDREHSIEVQLPFIQYHFKEPPPIVPIVIGSSSVATARDLAMALKPYFKPGNLFVISSDFSHYPPYQEAVRVDRSTGNAILENDPGVFYETLRKNNQAGVENLATPCCGWCSILTLLYMSEGEDDLVYTPILYRNSGHSPLGDRERVVGYWAIAGHQDQQREAGFRLEKSDEQALLQISRETLEAYLVSRTIPEIGTDHMPANLRQHAGAFVSLYKHGQLRGCIGNFQPGKPVYEVVREMSVAAATRDTRFIPVNAGELEQISIEISVLTPLRKISSIEEFELGRHGIYMIKDGHSGTYLPQVAEQTGWNREEFLGNCARHKAGIGWEGWKEADLYVYEAIVFGEPH